MDAENRNKRRVEPQGAGSRGSECCGLSGVFFITNISGLKQSLGPKQLWLKLAFLTSQDPSTLPQSIALNSLKLFLIWG